MFTFAPLYALQYHNSYLGQSDAAAKSAPASWLNFFTDDGQTFNGHHVWSNFEIASVKFFAGEQYQSYFDYLDRAGGFFHERWGDAPVHSLGVGLFANYDQVSFAMSCLSNLLYRTMLSVSGFCGSVCLVGQVCVSHCVS